MKIYNYHPETLNFVGESMPDKNPLEPGKYLIPAHATTTAPPEPQTGKVIKFIAGNWEFHDIPAPPAAAKPPTPGELRKMEINAQIATIDAKTTRAARAVVLAIAKGTAPAAADVDMLNKHEMQAQALRNELKGMA
jgi:hypothetical protein